MVQVTETDAECHLLARLHHPQGKVAESLLQRLILKPAKISQLAAGIRAIADQPEPIGQLVRRMEVAEGE
jgi:gamma-glutamyl phosphate reductase